MEKEIRFVDENNNEVVGEIIFQANIAGRDYAVVSVEKDAENVDLLAFRVTRNPDGTVGYSDLDETDDRAKINEVINNLING